MELLIWIFVFVTSCTVLLSGGVVFRSLYAWKVSDGVVSFIKNYFLSYAVHRKQINYDATYNDEVTANLMRLVCRALDDDSDTKHIESRFIPTESVLRFKTDKGYVLDFFYNSGRISSPYSSHITHSDKLLLPPIIFILSKKVVKKLERKAKAEKEKSIIDRFSKF